MENNSFFDKMVEHYSYGVQNFASMSRLEREEYAYSALGCVRDFYCSEYGVDPSKIDIGFARMPGSNGRNCIMKTDGDKVTETRVVLEIFEALKQNANPDALFELISHEMGHAIDCLTREGFLDEHRQLQSLKIDVYGGPGWWGRKDERIADEFAGTNMLRIFDHLIKQDPTNSVLLEKREAIATRFEDKAKKHEESAVELARIVQERQAGVQNADINKGQTNFANSNKMFKDRLVFPFVRNNKFLVDKIIEKETGLVDPQIDRGNPLFIQMETIREVAEDPQCVEFMTTNDFAKAEEGEIVPINSNPFESVDTKEETISEESFDTQNMSPDAIRDLGEVIKIQSGESLGSQSTESPSIDMDMSLTD